MNSHHDHSPSTPISNTHAIASWKCKTLDRVPHNLLLLKLSSLGIPSNIISWIENFLTGRKQFTTANDRQSPLTSVTSGVPQGASLSPLLFLIYINDLPNNIKSKLKLFADDCVIYNPIRSPADNIILQEDLDTISSWCEKSLMPLNLSKCKILSFSRKLNPNRTHEFIQISRFASDVLFIMGNTCRNHLRRGITHTWLFAPEPENCFGRNKKTSILNIRTTEA